MSEQPHQSSLFRQEALDHYARPEVRGTVLLLDPFWARVTYWLVLVLALILGVVLTVVEINDYATGPVLIQVRGLEDLTVTTAGRVSKVLVKRGQYVQAGQPLVELHSPLEEAERSRMTQEFRSQLAAGLMNPLDASSRQTLSSLRSQVDLSEARLSERVLRASVSGRIHDVRVRENQYLSAGQAVASILQDGSEVFALALVPGQYRPMLEPGQQIRMEVAGFPYVYQYFQVTSVSDELVGPAEVRRYLGPGLGDALPLQGPHVAVEGQLPGATFDVDGRSYSYYTGMPGVAWVRVRARNGWLTLLPVLELLGRPRG
ncbi:efflux RND transporter periplasmic adaptor subunit [Myxococcus qinghaiensis]|uniref:efflux RND transporter periplasmic adaptor subunit n=1 Tax=Myxococcus qinghaiensis TaxID=2906758 RepID=UPI0020A73941|nr:efflux RND transporter periplasmic adaptor subunit [Myxococcus qinghaiensis]MCP3166669.1 efflux RND transporter periplasmic adaptor subunit [Myxococcus qinghaiensis]